MKALFLFLMFIGLVAYGFNDLTQAVAGKAIKAHTATLEAI